MSAPAFGYRVLHARVSWVSDRRGAEACFLDQIQGCTRARSLERGREIHRELLDRGFFTVSVLQSSVIKMYAECGSMVDARKAFDSLPSPSVVCWNCLLHGYVDNGDWELALELFDESNARSPRSYVAALGACAALAGGEGASTHRWLEKGRSIHSSAVENGCSGNIFVQSSLVHFYSKAGSMVEARSVFDRMAQRNVVSWNALLQGYVDNGQSEVALELFEEMECLPGARSFVAAFTACATLATTSGWSKRKVLEKGMRIHAKANELRCCGNAFVQNSLMDMYGKCGEISKARQVFDSMLQRSAVSWTTLLRGYLENGESELAMELFDRMLNSGCSPNARTYSVALSACSDLIDEAAAGDDHQSRRKWLEKGKALHARAMTTDECSDNLFVQNTLVDLYARSGELELARRLFDKMKSRDLVSWNALLHGYAENRRPGLALELFNEMMISSCSPDARTFVSVISACSTGAENAGDEPVIQWLGKGKIVHGVMIRSLSLSDAYVDAALVNMYSKCRSMPDAQRVFDSMPHRCSVSWNSLAQGYAESGESEMALQTIAAMEKASRDCGTYAAGLMACGKLMALEAGKKLHEEMRSSGLEKDVMLATCLVDFYGKCGSMRAAREVFNGMPVRDLWVWNTLMCNYGEQGESEKVFEVFEEMRERGVEPNEITFTHLLAACSHSGMTTRGRECFEMMQKKFRIAPNIIHFNCLIDLLGRANKLDEALQVLEDMPCDGNSVSWMALLSACRKWNNVDIGRVAYQKLLSLDCINSAGYLLMANIAGSQGNILSK